MLAILAHDEELTGERSAARYDKLTENFSALAKRASFQLSLRAHDSTA